MLRRKRAGNAIFKIIHYALICISIVAGTGIEQKKIVGAGQLLVTGYCGT